MAFNTASIARVKNFYLKGVLAVYVVAFTSLYVQVQSLFGDNGVVPIRDYLSRSGPARGPLEPNLMSLAAKVGLSHGTFVELACLVCIVIAFAGLFIRRLANALSFGLLWYTYYSICSVGQGFMSFHSDLLLLEVGFITILLAPLVPSSRLSQSDHDHVTCFLIKWLVFRYFVTNVFSVYLDNDKSWYDMTAIPMVAQGVQFPSLLSWQVYNFSPEHVRLYQAYEHAVKLCAPFLFLFDLKYSRLIGFYTLLFVALPSALFFNFGWTDLLICICLLSFLRDAYFYTDKRTKQSGKRTFLDMIVLSTYVGIVGLILVKFYGFKYQNGVLKSQVMFTPAQFKLLIDHLVPVSLVLGTLGLLSSTYTTFFKTQRRTSIIKTLLYTVIAFGLFFSTFSTLTRFSPGLDNKIKPLALTKNLSRFVAPYMLSNNYILLSKVSQHYSDGRPELQLQARESEDSDIWRSYELRYKPGLPSRELIRVVPHLPRIELKMWYAARSSFQNNQWLQTLAYRLATNEKVVTDALLPSSPIIKPKQIRIVLMNYKYSSKSKSPFAGYWSHSRLVSDYMPATSIDSLRFNVKSNGISLTTGTKAAVGKQVTFDKLLNNYLEMSSDYIRKVDHTAVIWSLGAIAAVSMLR